MFSTFLFTITFTDKSCPLIPETFIKKANSWFLFHDDFGLCSCSTSVWILCVCLSGFGGDEIGVQTHKDRSPSDGIQYHRWANAAGTVNKTKRTDERHSWKCSFMRLRNLWFLHWWASLRLSSFRFTNAVCFHPWHASDAGSALLRV